MKGRLRLRVGSDGGRTLVREAEATFPIQLSRPLPCADGWLGLVLLMPCGGLLDGDELAVDIVVEQGARLDLRTQAATQLHAGRSSQTWSISVLEDGWLGYVPYTLTPHAGATHHTRVSARIASTANLLLAEALAPGRTLRGELFAYNEFRSDLDVWRAGQLVARERQRVRPEEGLVAVQLGPHGYAASAYILGPAAAEPTLEFEQPPGVELCTLALAYGGRCARLFGQRAIDLELALASVRDAWLRAGDGRDPFGPVPPRTGEPMREQLSNQL